MPTLKNILRSFFLLYWLGFLCTGLAQSPHPAFRHYSTNDGLASPEVYCILQDRKGYIWIATDNGVSRFDGYQFRNYGPADGLLENVVFRLQLDELGRVWMQGMSGKLYYTEGDTILSYWNNYFLDAFQHKINHGYGFVVQGKGDTVHVGTAGAGILTFNRFFLIAQHVPQEPFSYSAIVREGHFTASYYGAGPITEERRHSYSLIQQQITPPLYFNTPKGAWRVEKLPYYNAPTPGQPIQIYGLADDSWLVFGKQVVWQVDRNGFRRRSVFPHTTIHAGRMQDGRFFLALHYQKGVWIYPSIEAFWHQEPGDRWLQG